MLDDRKAAFATAYLCLLLIAVWHYSLFVSSVPPEETTAFVRSILTMDLSDAWRGDNQVVPLLFLWGYGVFVGSVTGGIASVFNRSRPSDGLLVESILVGGIGALTAVISAGVLCVVGFAFDHETFLPGTNLLQRIVAVLFLVPGISTYAAIPAMLGSIGGSCAIHALNKRPMEISRLRPVATPQAMQGSLLSMGGATPLDSDMPEKGAPCVPAVDVHRD